MMNTTTVTKEQIFEILDQVPDPEVPVLSTLDLGIIREVLIGDDGVEIIITPTYTGCPAMNMFEVNIIAALQVNGIP
ncbi:MAG TPA: iron-sulfur cluster assembly protein, partial [Saprospiraceae bacterium]|nr:iron-sulfur cluster assembly protein [Saprospiraceae bacterium]